jgi:hypothetical protein
VSSWLSTDLGWRVDRYNGTFATGRCTGLADGLGTVLGTVGALQPSNWREILKIVSNFNAVRWPRG